MDYKHFYVNHSKGFVNPEYSTIHTNNIENKWSQIRKFVKRNVSLEYMDIFMKNFLFFIHTDERQRYSILIKFIKNRSSFFSELLRL